MIAIILILSAILFPIFATAREKARQTACLSNERQLGLAIIQYTQDNEDGTQSISIIDYVVSYGYNINLVQIASGSNQYATRGYYTVPATLRTPCEWRKFLVR